MRIEVDCSDCDGVGLSVDKKGKEHTCPSCKGKGTTHEEVDTNPSEEAFNDRDCPLNW